MRSHSASSASAATGLMRLAIPVAGISEIAFLPVQVGVNPRAIAVVDVLRDAVRGRPVSTRVVPQRDEQRRDRRRRR